LGILDFGLTPELLPPAAPKVISGHVTGHGVSLRWRLQRGSRHHHPLVSVRAAPNYELSELLDEVPEPLERGQSAWPQSRRLRVASLSPYRLGPESSATIDRREQPGHLKIGAFPRSPEGAGTCTVLC
jgi:hypothetical protein